MIDSLPKKGYIWVVFDLDNGHEPSKHYCWWFNTRKGARNHISHQKTYKNAAKLSTPQKYFHSRYFSFDF